MLVGAVLHGSKSSCRVDEPTVPFHFAMYSTYLQSKIWIILTHIDMDNFCYEVIGPEFGAC